VHFIGDIQCCESQQIHVSSVCFVSASSSLKREPWGIVLTSHPKEPIAPSPIGYQSTRMDPTPPKRIRSGVRSTPVGLGCPVFGRASSSDIRDPASNPFERYRRLTTSQLSVDRRIREEPCLTRSTPRTPIYFGDRRSTAISPSRSSSYRHTENYHFLGATTWRSVPYHSKSPVTSHETPITRHPSGWNGKGSDPPKPKPCRNSRP